MYDVKFSLPGPDTITLSGQTVDRLLRACDGDAALLYLYILKTRGESTSEETMAALGKGPGWLASAMAVLSRLKLIELDNKDAGPLMDGDDGSGTGVYPEVYADSMDAESKSHASEEMRRELEAGTEFSFVYEEAQRVFGRLLSPDEGLRLFGIYKGQGLSPEVILQLINYCFTESKRTGGGRGLSMMRYIEKAAQTWALDGIFTLDMAEEYIKKLEALRKARGEAKTVMQINNREFSASERRFVDGWFALGFDIGAVEIAYEMTVEKQGHYNISYMDGIMKNWHKKGVHTAREIQTKTGGRGNRNVNVRESTFGVQGQEEIARMQRLLDKTKKS